jgi:hypothetical protein
LCFCWCREGGGAGELFRGSGPVAAADDDKGGGATAKGAERQRLKKLRESKPTIFAFF